MTVSLAMLDRVSAQVLGPDRPQLPKGFRLIHTLHEGWKIHQRYGNPKTRAAMIPGNALYYLAGDKMCVRALAHCILVVATIQKCLDQQQIFRNALTNWEDAVKGRYAYCDFSAKGVTPLKNNQWRLLSPSTAYNLKCQKNAFCTYASRVAKATRTLFSSAFTLSMHMITLTKSLTLDPEVHSDATKELFANLGNLAENSNELEAKFQKHRTLILEVFPKKGPQIVAFGDHALKTVTQIHKQAVKVSKATDGVLLSLVQRHLSANSDIQMPPHPLVELAKKLLI